MSKRFGKARVHDCACTHNFTCGPCLRACVDRNLADINSGALVPIPDFGGPSYVRKNHPAAALYAPCEAPAFGTPAWDEAERKRALIISSNAQEP